MYEKNSSSDIKASEEGGGGDAPGISAEIPLQPMVKTVVRQTMEDYSLNRWMPRGGCDPVESLCWSRLVRTCDPAREPCLSSLSLKESTLWKRSMLEQWEGMEKMKVKRSAKTLKIVLVNDTLGMKC